jgi:transcriptional regulator with XRE-family HTH domain
MLNMTSNQERLENLGRVMADLMDRHGVTQLELAERMDMHPETVERWLAGKQRPRPLSVQAFASALGVTEEERMRFALAYVGYTRHNSQ